MSLQYRPYYILMLHVEILMRKGIINTGQRTKRILMETCLRGTMVHMSISASISALNILHCMSRMQLQYCHA